jgi:ABC-type Fe3+-hydroxamate transport system substrate-binding protein
VPSQTELLYDLGLRDEVVGITKFCIHPDEWFRTKTRVGGTKSLHLERIRELQPDLVLANREENVKEQVEALAKEFAVYTSDINDLPSALQMISDIGKLTGKMNEAEALNQNIRTAFATLQMTKSIPACYLIWRKPYMTVGGDTFIHQMMKEAGFENVYAKERRYPEIQLESIPPRCRVLLLSSEPYPFSEKHVTEIKAEHPHLEIMLVDGEYFSWYGSRMLKAPAYFEKIYLKSLEIIQA